MVSRHYRSTSKIRAEQGNSEVYLLSLDLFSLLAAMGLAMGIIFIVLSLQLNPVPNETNPTDSDGNHDLEWIHSD